MKDVKPNETFTLESDGEEHTCRVITSLYAEDRKVYYLVYEYVPANDEIYVSSFDPDDETGELRDVTDEVELREIANYLKEYGVEEDDE